MGCAEEAERAVAAARAAFSVYAATSLSQRKDLLAAVIAEYQNRLPDFASAVCEEMGAPLHTLATPCLLYTSPSPRDRTRSRMPSSA